ncbi:MAG: Protein-L-isoaspartate O-methyltransferase [Candidatus Methanofastidiosum methylothiophilum]|uniref:Arsenite methyltransferase n=1 Tax=Candidatus Methanofastidiosum methylothiophilum TaxID=1705564 RepID=A0A150ILI2_9EURY|nr:MAG: Protein-L-isoaspartate O-methyltransferase [Candidatus Methanofastidiosum methylthiophilus]KYC48381.1 MAG: Protein-L-isoaspartate O-methyltransferase [Candidatus Methanofastidiosum methylthiophilus]KYC50754.1 MAG: Protein-L-isoaspartate O-methyltransferase [Candidatus Methanofastidiosum methylthiophilus]
MRDEDIKRIVKENYSKIASSNCGCSCGCSNNNELIAKSLGYSDTQIGNVSEANLGLGCGNPTALGEIKEGEVVLDLGSGAGLDCFLAADKVGENGKVIGVDFTETMIQKATQNAKKYGYKNVEFRYGDIENLPIEASSVDVILSNCVVNLVPDKVKAFKEAYRVLKKGGKMYISDIVLLQNLSDDLRKNEMLLVSCVAGAILKEDYLKIIKDTGFEISNIKRVEEISVRQYWGLPIESLSIVAIKN